MSRLVLLALLWLQLQFGALRVLERLPGAWGEVALAVVWIASALGIWALVHGAPHWRVLRTPWPSITLVALVAVCAVVVYPEVDGRRSTGGGSDADDAVVLVVDRMRDGLDPFGADTYLGNPPTTGPGSLLWAAPFPGRGPYAFAIVLAVGGALVWLRRRHGSWVVPSIVAVLLGASVPFWEGVAQGTDHLAMACGLALLATGVHQRDGSVRLLHSSAAAVAVAAGVLATWRAAYLHLPVLLAAALWRRSRRAAVVVAVGGTAVALALHAALLSWTDGGWDAYDPVQQLFVKSNEDLSSGGRALVLAGVAAGAAVALRELARPRPRADVLVLAGIGAPLGAIAVAGAIAADDPAGWSEASYLLPTLVLAAVVTAQAVVGSRAP